MVPIMYRQRCPARVAFAQAVDLVTLPSRAILLYVLFLLLLAVAMVMISCAVTCATFASLRFRTSAPLYFCQFQ